MVRRIALHPLTYVLGFCASGAGLIVAGVAILAGTGYALVTAGVALIAGARFISRGMTSDG